MLIEKIFHIHQSVAGAKTCLSNLRSYRRELDGVQKATVTADGVAQFEFDAGFGFNAVLELAEVPSNDPDQVLFKSVAGNADVAGIIEYCKINDDLTEVTLTVEYTIKSGLYRMMDMVTASLDRFLNRQLKRIDAYMAGAAPAFVPERAPHWERNVRLESTPRFV